MEVDAELLFRAVLMDVGGHMAPACWELPASSNQLLLAFACGDNLVGRAVMTFVTTKLFRLNVSSNRERAAPIAR
jgi:hypothetical protein